MRVLIAPNAFKNSLSAPDAGEAIRRGILESGLAGSTACFPIGDGGDGTATLIIKNRNGISYETEGSDPLGRKIKTKVGFIDEGKTAVIEMADISGMKLLGAGESDPMRASSLGTGQLIGYALDRGARKIILCVGGSATVDGGSGALQAMGVHFLDQSKKLLNRLPEDLVRLSSVDVTGLDKRILHTDLILLCDVDNTLLGEKGSAAVFGPQKGASKADVTSLEKGLHQLKEVVFQQTGKDMSVLQHGGAAGGLAAGLCVFLQAKLIPGTKYFLDMTNFDNALEKADLLITGEGSIDLQTMEGKGPFVVAQRAKIKNIPVIGLAGSVSPEAAEAMGGYFKILKSINPPGEDIQTAMQHTSENLQRTAREIGYQFKMQ